LERIKASTKYSHGQNTVITICGKNALEFWRTARREHRCHYCGRRRNSPIEWKTRV